MKRLHTTISVLILLGGGLSAQDIHFSQFYMSPLTLNPALTGVMNCNTRFVANYRNQWSPVISGNAYNTYSVSADQKLPVGRYDNFGVGINLWGDVAGSLDFQTLTAKVTGSYAKRVAGSRRKSHYVVGGVELGISQRSVDFINAQWPSQAGQDGNFDPALDPGEDFSQINDRFMFEDLGLGLLWFSVLGDHTNFYVGGAYAHLNQPNVSFFEDGVVSYFSKAVVHAGGEFEITGGVSLLPGIVGFFQGPSMEINGGTSIRFAMGSDLADQSFQLGAWFRLANHFEDVVTADAVILSARFDMGQFGIGFSYDVNVSSLRQASNANGSFEFSAIYQICGAQSRGVYCPKF